jgi:alpha-tubulin suppressor-like RCC1 family protein
MGAVAILLAASGCRDEVPSPVEPVISDAPAEFAATTALTFRQISAGESHTCGVTTDYRAYCWGEGLFGALGNGTSYGPEVCGADNEAGCSTRPVAVLGGLRFQSVSAGAFVTCGVTTDGRAFCWGDNVYGQLGDGTTTLRLTPVAVHGGHLFRQVSAGYTHTCGLTTDDRIYCWGYNGDGELGNGTLQERLTPGLVAGTRLFRLVSAGDFHTCALTTEDRAFCWGRDLEGELGDSSTSARRLVPVRVAGGRSFGQLSSGSMHTCAVTIGSRGFCWGRGQNGELGSGGTSAARWPRAVAGGLSYHRITAGGLHTCAESTGNQAYCWGTNIYGQVGNGTQTGPDTCYFGPCSTRPSAVVGGHSFVQVDAGYGHVCARTGDNTAYCWGDSYYGQDGDGLLFYWETVPKAVLAPL